MIKRVCALILVAISSLMFSLVGTAQQAETDNNEHKTGTASFYHQKFEGRKTANGEIFDNDLYTCASNHYKLGTYLKITNIANKKVVYVKVNDRMGHPSRIIDLTSRAAKDLNFYNKGLAKVKIEVMSKTEGREKMLAQFDNKANASKDNEL